MDLPILPNNFENIPLDIEKGNPNEQILLTKYKLVF
jgi:hypothetical protein